MDKSTQAQLRIGVALNIFSILQSHLIIGIQDYIRKKHRNWRIQVAEVTHLADPKTPVPSFDGAIVLPPENILLYQKEFPVVLIRGDTLLLNLNIPTIEISHRRIVEIAIEHLLSKGFKRIGFASYPTAPHAAWIARREESFLHCCKENGTTASVFTPDAAMEANRTLLLASMGRWLASMDFPFAVLAINDVRAMDVIQCCRENGMRIPDDIALLGIDNNPAICPFVDPPLTSIALNYRGLGFEAAAMLDAQLGTPDNIPVVQPFDVFTLMERASTDILAPQDPLVEQALQFIVEHCHDPIQNSEICSALGVSYTLLNRRFTTSMNSSLHDNLQKARLQRAKKMLADPQCRLKEIASACGFQNPQYFSTVFRRKEGMTPKQYRELHRNGQKFIEAPGL